MGWEKRSTQHDIHEGRGLHTVHKYLHIVEYTVDNLHGLRGSPLRFFLGESVQPL